MIRRLACLLGLLLALVGGAPGSATAQTTTDYFGGGLYSGNCGPGLYANRFEITTARYVETILIYPGLGTIPAGTEIGLYTSATLAGPYSLVLGTTTSTNLGNSIYPIEQNLDVGYALITFLVPPGESFPTCIVGDGDPSNSWPPNLSFGTLLDGGSAPGFTGPLPATLDTSVAGLSFSATELYGGEIVTGAVEIPPVAVLTGTSPFIFYEDGSGSSRYINIDGAGSYDPDGTITSMGFSCGGTPAPGQQPWSCGGAITNCDCLYLNDDNLGSGTLTVIDNQGLSDSVPFEVQILNLPPTAAAVCDNGTCSGIEGDTLSFTCTSTDPGWNDVPTIDWDFDGTVVQGPRVGTGGFFGNGQPFTATNDYPDDGTFSATCDTADDDGGSDSQSLSVTIANVAPTIGNLSGPGNTNEGSTVNYVAAATDPGVNDVLTFNWTFGDGNLGLGTGPTNQFLDDGVYTVTLTVDDGDGGQDVQTMTTTVANVAPTLTGSCPTSATEGTDASFGLSATDPGVLDVFSWSLSSTASGASLTASTGASSGVSWMPSYTDAQAGTVTLDVDLDDGDGGTDALACSVAVAYLDADADGMPDTWEGQNGLNPAVDDAAADPDGDGISNYDEWLAGSDPQVSGGPSAPVASAPVGDAEVGSQTPDLTWTNATDPDGDPLTYTWEVYADAGLTTFVTGASGVAEGSGSSTTITVSATLSENTAYWWRVRANDGNSDSSWSSAAGFFVNVANDAPGQPTAASPTLGELVSSLTPTLQWSEVTDDDGDAITYAVEVYEDAALTSLAWDADSLVGSSGTVEAVAGTLVENGSYWWRAQAVDEHGLAGAWSATESFLVSLVNDAPSAPVFDSPNDGGQVALLAPVLEVSGSVDPEGDAVEYEVELSLDMAFAGTVWASGLLTDAGGVSWDSSEEGAALTEDGPAWARARALDGAGVASGWTTITFTANSANDAPSVPVLIEPDDGVTVLDLEALTFRWANSTDPDGTTRTYDVEVRDTADNVVWESLDVAETATETSVEMPANELPSTADYTWSVRSLDELGVASDWAEPFAFTYEQGGDDDDSTGDDDDATGDDDDTADDDDSVDDDDVSADDDDSAGPGDGGCACSSSVAAGPSAGLAWLVALGLGLGLRRRRG